jgi:polysaccharide deacetylase 2 family uncharacterized protein YibQ
MAVEKKRRPPVRKPKAKARAKAKPKAKAKPQPRVKSARKPANTTPRQLSSALLGVAVLAVIVVTLGVVAYLFLPKQPVQSTAPKPETEQKTVFYEAPKFEIYHEEVFETTTASAPSSQTPVLPEGTRPIACIIIDDIGYDAQIAGQFLGLDVPLTFSILPFSPFRERITKAASAKNIEIMLHLPMEPEGYPKTDPGLGALLTTMSPDALIHQLNEDIASVPGAVGVNNHMGSKMTTVSAQMYQIFSILKREGLFFIDSRTTVNTLCKPSARLLQVPFAERDIFLDHEETETFVRKQIRKLIETAKQEGRAVGIGHPHDVTYEVLKEMLPELQQEIRLVPASELVEIIG